MSTSQEVERNYAFLLAWKGDLKSKGQREASVKFGAGWLEGSVPAVSEGVGWGTQVWTSRIGRGWSWFDPRNQTWVFFSLAFFFFPIQHYKILQTYRKKYERILYRTPINSPPRLNH